MIEILCTLSRSHKTSRNFKTQMRCKGWILETQAKFIDKVHVLEDSSENSDSHNPMDDAVDQAQVMQTPNHEGTDTGEL